MKKIFLSLPMSGRSAKEIRAQIEEMMNEFLASNHYARGEEVLFVDNLGYEPDYRDYCKIEALTYLGGAIDKLAYVDSVYFGKGWTRARGCIIEWQTCMKYGIPRYIMLRDGSITKMIDPKEEDRDE